MGLINLVNIVVARVKGTKSLHERVIEVLKIKTSLDKIIYLRILDIIDYRAAPLKGCNLADILDHQYLLGPLESIHANRIRVDINISVRLKFVPPMLMQPCCFTSSVGKTFSRCKNHDANSNRSIRESLQQKRPPCHS